MPIIRHPGGFTELIDTDTSPFRRSGMDFLQNVDKEQAEMVETVLFENSALQAMAPAAEVYAQASGAAVLNELRQGANEAEADFDLSVTSNEWDFFGFTGSGRNIHMHGSLRVRSNKPR